MRPNLQTTRGGFTIVELLIVVVVIAILAAITIVSYNGIQQRTRFTAKMSDIKALQKGIELYYADTGSYPNTSSAWKYQRLDGDNFIPGLLAGNYMNTLPSITDGKVSGQKDNTYVYKSDGKNYKLIRLCQSTSLCDITYELTQIPTSMKDQNYNTDRWGVWSPGGAGY